MGSLCSCCGGNPEECNKKTGDELSEGPVANRGCTDIFCLPIFAFAQVVFLIVTIAGVADGDPTKLYKPRDFQGAYCGTEVNWNDGPKTTDQPFMSYTMNVTSTVDTMMKQLVCSSVAQKALVEGDSGASIAPLLATEELRQQYLCDCCISPCKKCRGSLEVGGDLTSGSQLSSTIGGRMGELTNTGSGTSLFSPSGYNKGMFSATSFWSEATKYFNKVCLPSCTVNFNTINASTPRAYTYKPAKDDPLYNVWSLLLGATPNAITTELVDSITTAFTFKALPLSVCPYEPAYCVPFPGLEFKELGSGTNYCQFELASEVVSSIGSAAASTFEGLGGTAMSNAASQSFGEWAGDFQVTIDAFIVVSLLSFIVGILFLVGLRFFIGICVWTAIFMTVLCFFLGGAMSFVRSGQCANAGFFDSGKQTAVAVAVAGSTAVSNAVTGTNAVSEAMTGDGQDYRGVQRRTKSGLACATWNVQTVMPWYNSTSYPNFDLTNDYCRNPWKDGDFHKASTIWCITSDPEILWEECLPIGVIQPECPAGYAVSSENARTALYYAAWVIWALGIIWIAIILCFRSRIKLAIALNKVAAHFLSTNPLVLIVPIVQALLGVVWCLLWMLSASFLLSQVPDSYTPKGGFTTYEEAYGTTSSCAFWETGDHCGATPGKCNDKWPTGFVWKDSDCGTGAVPACWKCYPPRYIFDLRFAISFFVFLWNNAFNVALGQIIIAMAVSIWFFSREKGKTAVVARAVKTIFRYHVGSVAFGSFIVAVVQFIRYLMKYLEKQASAQKNRVMVLVFKIVQCCLWCFEKCIKFLNKNAYIQIALHGTNFCTAAKQAFFLILRNALRFATVAALSGAVHLIGFVCIMAGTVIIGYFLVRAMHDEINPVIPCISYLFMSYIVAKLFMNVFGLAVDTSLQCFIACEEMGDRDFDIPRSLKGFVNNNVKDKKDDDDSTE